MLFVTRYKSVRLIPFLLLSGLLHATLIMVLPDLTRLFNIHIKRLALLSETVFEVSLVEPVIIPDSPVVEKSSPQLADDYVSALIDHRLKKLSALGEASLSPPALITLPELSPPEKSELLSLPLPELLSIIRPQELLGRLSKNPAGRLSGNRLGGSLKQPAAESGALVEEMLSLAGQKKLLAIEIPEKDNPNRDFGLSGPVARSRQVLFRPELPKISLAKDVSVDFRFWVRPDGRVNRVETLKIGDLELVNVAERFLQQWRFSTLASDVPQQEQWGTVTIVFRVSR